jgi:hypothetical protein
MTGKFAPGALALFVFATAIPTGPVVAQYRQFRTETETRECRTTAGFGSVRLPRASQRPGYQTRNCRVELRCPGLGDKRACFRASKQCGPWPGTCSSR